MKRLVLFTVLSVFLWSAHAEVKPHALFSENAVLQLQTKVPVWGTATDGERVTVEMQGQNVAATVTNGQWQATLQPLRAGGPFSLTIRGDHNTIIRTNILVGEVWICSGQSNMGWGLGGSEKPEQIATHADIPSMRLFRLTQNPQEHPQHNIAASWGVCTPKSAYAFSAVGYYFGRDLHKALKVPVGLIQSTIGGSYAHTWMPARYLEADPGLRPLLNFWEETKQRYAKRLEAYRDQEPVLKKKYGEELAKARAEGQPEPKPPQPPGDNPETDHRNMTAAGYNGMIAPLQPYAFRGVAWYQGENDCGDPRYRTTLPTMIRAWREIWGRGDFPFLIVQLPAYTYRGNPPGDLRWPIMREIQWWISQHVTNSGIVVTIDCGNPANRADLHPPLKEPVGQRLALLARALVYGESIEYFGPVFDTMSIESDLATIRFRHIGDGLVAKGDELTGFTIAGEDQKFVNARARIEGEKVIVSSPQVTKPVAVRYAWADYPECNLYNKAGLPAAPFRTDDFPLALPK